MLAVLLASVATAAAIPVPSLQIEQRELPNGMVVVLQPDPSEALVAVNVRYALGSWSDPPGQKGIAHLVEHMMFDRSEPESGDFFEEMEAIGGTGIGAHTSFDHTEYYELVTRQALPVALWLEAQRMQRLAFDAAALEREKRVVENEMMERRHDTAFGFAESLLIEGLFPKPHALHHGPLGTMEHLDRIRPADIQKFHDRNYGPQGATLVISGGFDPAEVNALVEQLFAPIPPRRPIRPMAPEPPRLRARPIFSPERIASRTRLSFLWPAPPPRTQASRSLEVFATMLGYRAALANYRERSIDGLGASIFHTPAGRLFRIDALVTGGMSFAMARGRVQSIIETYVWVAPQTEELEGAKKRLRLGFLRALASIQDRAHMLQDAHASFGDARALGSLPRDWSKVTASDIQTALNRYVVGEPQLEVAKPIRR